MFLLLFFVLLIQFFTYWIFEPLASLLEYVLEIRLIPIIALIGLVFLFSACQTLIKTSAVILTKPQSPPSNLEELKKISENKKLPR